MGAIETKSTAEAIESSTSSIEKRKYLEEQKERIKERETRKCQDEVAAAMKKLRIKEQEAGLTETVARKYEHAKDEIAVLDQNVLKQTLNQIRAKLFDQSSRNKRPIGEPLG